MIRLNDREFCEIVGYIRDNYGINLEKKQVLIECRMARELEKRGLTSFAQYMEQMRKDRTGEMAGEMVNRLTTNYTYFMREPAHFSILNNKILPELFENRKMGGCSIWNAGCSTGEEVYSIAMLIQDYGDRFERMPAVRILATDISAEVLRKAEKGIYPLKEMEDLPELWKRKYCTVEDNHTFRVDEKLKYNIRFRRHNLMEMRPGPEKFDLILCRNVMIYFDRISREKLIKQLERCLSPGGYLLVGHAELLSREETRLEAVFPAVYKKPVKENEDRGGLYG